MSRTGDAAAMTIASVVCHQVAEYFSAALFSPVSAERSMNAALSLLSTTRLFAPATLDRIDGFARRLRKMPPELLEAAEEDLHKYYEQSLGGESPTPSRSGSIG